MTEASPNFLAFSLRPYQAVVSARFRALLQYRAAAFAGFATQLFWGIIRVTIFTAFYAASPQQPISLPDMISYLWLTQAMFALAMWNVDQDIRTMIRTGTVAYEMLRPVDLYSLWYSRALASRLAPTILRALPMFVIATLFLGLRLPPSWTALGAWMLTTCAALGLAAALSTLLTISLLYTVSSDGITRLAPTLMYVFSGMLLPLPLMPAWAQPVVNFLPFHDIIDTPFRLYSGNIPVTDLGPVLAHQLIWLAVLIGAGRVLLQKATHRLVVQGG